MTNYGLEFETNTGKVFSLTDIQPIVYVGKYRLTGNRSITVESLNGRGTLYPELLSRDWLRSGNGQVSSLVRYSYNNSISGSITITFSNVNIASFWADFAIYARF